MATNARLTAQDLLRLGGDVRRELVDGRVIEMPPHGFAHGEITGAIYALLREHVQRVGGGRVAVGDVGLRLQIQGDLDRVRGPDIVYVSFDRLPSHQRPDGFLDGAPDLVVEVLSASDSTVDMEKRIQDYLEAGARLVWLFAPPAKTVTVYRAGSPTRLLRIGDSLDGEDVLPGLSIDLSRVL